MSVCLSRNVCLSVYLSVQSVSQSVCLSVCAVGLPCLLVSVCRPVPVFTADCLHGAFFADPLSSLGTRGSFGSLNICHSRCPFFLMFRVWYSVASLRLFLLSRPVSLSFSPACIPLSVCLNFRNSSIFLWSLLKFTVHACSTSFTCFLLSLTLWVNFAKKRRKISRSTFYCMAWHVHAVVTQVQIQLSFVSTKVAMSESEAKTWGEQVRLNDSVPSVLKLANLKPNTTLRKLKKKSPKTKNCTIENSGLSLSSVAVCEIWCLEL